MKRLSLAFLVLVSSLGGAQSLPLLTRTTSTTGLNDSALTLISDSAQRTRAATVLQYRKALSVHAFDSLLTTKLNLTGGTVTGAPTWSSLQTFAAGQRVDSATGAARSQILTTARTINGTSFDGSGNITVTAAAGTLTGATLAAGVTSSSLTSFGANARTDSSTGAARASALVGSPAITVSSCTGCGGTPQDSIRLKNGAAATPSLMFANSLTSGLYRFGADSIGFANAGVGSWMVSGGATAKLTGGAGNGTVLCGTGNSRTCTFQSTTSAGTAKNTLVLGADTSVTALGQLRLIKSASTCNDVDSVNASIKFTPSAGRKDTNICYTSNGNSFVFVENDVQALTIDGTSGVTLQTAGQQFTGPSTSTVTSPVFRTGASETQTGFYRFAANKIGVTLGGAHALQISGNASVAITGGAGSMTLASGTGNSRRLSLQTTTSAGAQTEAVHFNELQQSLFADGAAATPGIGWASDTLLGLSRVGTAGASDTIRVSANGVAQMKIAPAGVLLLPNLPSEGSTKNAVCWDGTTFNVTQNAAATCTVSSRRFKENITPLSVDDAWGIASRLTLSQYRYKATGVRAIGVIAEDAYNVDTRLATRDHDGKGQINATNYEELGALWLPIVQRQQQQIDSLRKQVADLAKRVRP